MVNKMLAYMTKGFKVEVVYTEEDEIVCKKTLHVSTEHTGSVSNYLNRIAADLKHSNAEPKSIKVDKNTIGKSNEPYLQFLFTNMRNEVRAFEHGKVAYEELYHNVYGSREEMLTDVFNKIDSVISEYHNAYHDYLKQNSLVKL